MEENVLFESSLLVLALSAWFMTLLCWDLEAPGLKSTHHAGTVR